MAKTKTKSRSNSSKDILHKTSPNILRTTPKNSLSRKTTEELLTEAATLLEQSQPDLALPLVEEALKRLEQERDAYSSVDSLLRQSASGEPTFPEALTLGADINLALGDADTARIQFLRATRLDPDGALISAEPWLWLSQLCEDGGRESIGYFEKASEVLRNEIDLLEEAEGPDQNQDILQEKRGKLADALCGMAEIYMTDLSWEDDCETKCEQFVTEAVAICPEQLSAGVLQVFASVRISQERMEEARRVLAHSMTIWKDLPPEVEDPARPDFATRVSLARLLMDVEAETDALFVIEGLMKEDDQSIEALYLAGWCHVLISKKSPSNQEDLAKHQQQAASYFVRCLKLYQIQDYEDTKLKDHALELLRDLNHALGIEGHDEDDWEDADEDDAESGGDDELEINHVDAVHDEDVEMT